jgi:hypothetical protein
MKQQPGFTLSAVLVSMAMLGSGCGPTGPVYSSNHVPNMNLFPYVRSDSTYTSYVSVFNHSEYTIDVAYTYRDANGIAVSTKQTTLNPHAGERSSQPNFTGSVSVYGEGEGDALFSLVEIRRNDGQGVALSEPAGSAQYVWFYELGVKDNGPNQDRSTLATYNFSDSDPIYVEYSWGDIICPLTGEPAAAFFYEVKIPPRGLHTFRPYDQTGKAFEGIVGVSATTGPGHTGTQVDYHAGTVFREGLTDISLSNYKAPHRPYASSANYPAGYQDWYKMYFADVQDDGVNRKDRIHLKLNATSGNTIKYVAIPFYFYDKSGTTLAYTPANPVKLAEMFSREESFQVVSPMELLGKKFSGSIWIDNPYSLRGALEATIVREAPNQWADLADYSPAAGTWQGYNALPGVSNNDAGWIYQIVLFYPQASLNTAPPAPKDAPPTFSGPTVAAPSKPGGGYVYLKFYDLAGKYKGTFAFKMSANETLYKPFNDPSITTHISDFVGSVVIEPRDVIVQLELQDKNGAGHASTGNWYSAKSH